MFVIYIFFLKDYWFLINGFFLREESNIIFLGKLVWLRIFILVVIFVSIGDVLNLLEGIVNEEWLMERYLFFVCKYMWKYLGVIKDNIGFYFIILKEIEFILFLNVGVYKEN